MNRRVLHLFAFLLFASRLLVAQEASNSFRGFPADHERPVTTPEMKNTQGMLTIPAPSAVDTAILRVVNSVNAINIRGYINSLQNFTSRYLYNPNRDSVAGWIKTQFLNMGYTDVVLDSFYILNTWQKNVVVTIPGRINPNTWCVVGGHYDSYSSNLNNAPGADDNASGTAAVLEIGRVIKLNNYSPENTIKLVAFAAEELGLYGGRDYAQKCAAQGQNIKLMINHDMISTSTQSVTGANVNINYYSGAENWRELTKSITSQYSSLQPLTGAQNSSGSDSHPFWQAGYPAVYFEEYQFSPVYHTPGDTIGNCNIPYCAQVIRSSCAMLLYTCKLPDPVTDYTLRNTGTGRTLWASWAPSPSTDFKYFRVRVGRASGVYDTSFTTTVNDAYLINLTDSVKYYVAISTVSLSNMESSPVERSCVPATFPNSPLNLVISPEKTRMTLNWEGNQELDLAGYNIYRADNASGPFVKLNTSTITVNTFKDSTAKAGIYYSYNLKAIDSSGLESKPANIRGRLFSLDRGICVINESKGGDGSVLYPSTAQFDAFYKDILTGFRYDTLNVNGYPKVTISDLGAYSTIIWHGNDNQDVTLPGNSISELTKYLIAGGKIIFSVYKPSAGIMNNINTTNVYTSGAFIYDFLKIEKTYIKGMSRFFGAKAAGSNTYPLYVDTTKTSSSYNYHLPNIESIGAAPGGENIFLFDSRYDSASSQGNLKGYPVGVQYTGGPHKAVTLSFPLYHIKKEQAAAFIKHVLQDIFNEPLAMNDDQIANNPADYELLQNFPNPFNPSTIIRFTVPAEASGKAVKLRLFDILGNTVAALVDEPKAAGSYSVNFNSGGRLASGVYYYQLTAGGNSLTRKMILLK